MCEAERGKEMCVELTLGRFLRVAGGRAEMRGLTASLDRMRSTAEEYKTPGEFEANNSVVKLKVRMTNSPPPRRMIPRLADCRVARPTMFSSIKAI